MNKTLLAILLLFSAKVKAQQFTMQYVANCNGFLQSLQTDSMYEFYTGITVADAIDSERWNYILDEANINDRLTAKKYYEWIRIDTFSLVDLDTTRRAQYKKATVFFCQKAK